MEEKADLLLRANAAALAAPGVRFVSSAMLFVKEEKSYANSDGTFTQQTVLRSWMPFTATAVSVDRTDFQSRGEVIQPMGRGYEYLLEMKPAENARQWGEQAAEKLKAKSVEVGRYDLLLHPSHLFLTIHESVAHPTELDRALGYEANYAGTSFVAPPRDVLGKLRFGSDLMHVVGERDQPGSLAAIGWDDEGVKPDRFDIVRDGMLVDYQTTREQAPMLDWWYERQGKPVRSHGCSYAQRASDVQFQRMPNVSLMPGTKDLGMERPRRGHRPRHRDLQSRLVLDRPAAIQRAVRRPALLRDQGREDRRDAQGRRLSDAHPRVLGVARSPRRREQLGDGRAHSTTARDSRASRTP